MKVDLEKMERDLTPSHEMISKIHRLIVERTSQTEEEEKPMSIQEASEFLHLSVDTLYRNKRFPRVKQGKRVLFYKSKLIEYITSL